MKKLFLAAALAAAPACAFAQGVTTIIPNTGPLTPFTTGSVTTSSSTMLAAPTLGKRQYLYIINPSPSVAVYCNFGAAAVVGASPIVLAPGTPRGDVLIFEGVFVPSDALNCIAGSATTIYIGKK